MGRAALVTTDSLVANVVLIGDDPYDAGGDVEVVDVADDDPVGPGWRRTVDGFEPPATADQAAPDEILVGRLDEIAGRLSQASTVAGLRDVVGEILDVLTGASGEAQVAARPADRAPAP